MIKSLLNFFKSSSRRESEKEVARLYYLYRKKFIASLVNYNDMDEETAEDIYHESFMTMHEDLLAGKLEDTDDVSLKKYLYGIGNNLKLKYFREERKLPKTDLDMAPELMEPEGDLLEWREKEKIARQLVASMKEQCKDLLNLFYWEELTPEEVLEITDYKDKDSVKTQKYKCKDKLIKELKRRFPNMDWI